MPNETLEETLKGVMEETKTPPATSQDTTQAKESAETTSGEPAAKEYVGGVDISDVPEQDRPRIKELLSKKVQLVEKGAQEKFKEIAKYKKEKEALLAAGVSEDEAVAVLNQHIRQKQSPTTARADDLRTLDKLIKDSPYEQKESLENLRRIISEETGASDLKKELDEIKRTLGIVNNERATTRVQSLNDSLDVLAKDYGQEVIDKYKDDIIKQGLAYPQADAKRLLFAVADPEDIEQAALSKANRKTQTQTQKKIAAVTTPNSGVSGTQESVDLGKTSMKDILRGILK